MKKKILVITKYEWDDRLASGNTLSNMFEDWDEVEFCNIYCREQSPNNNCCNHYYTITPIDLAKHFFIPWKIGRRFETNGKHSEFLSRHKTESSLKSLSKNYQRLSEIVYDILYSSRLWLNRRLKIYIREFEPDMIFVFGTPDPLNYFIIKYCRRSLNIPIVSYYVDDHYNNKKTKWNIFEKVQRRRLKKIAEISTKCYAISKLMCDEYSVAFNKEFTLLFKGCKINPVKKYVNTPVRIVYAGNLFYGRGDVLSELAAILSEINVGTNKAHLDIYTSTKVEKKMDVKLNIPDTSKIHSQRPYEEIKKIMSDSDVVLHVESFREEQVKIVRLSFSTKVTDCLQSGSMTVGVGPKNIASISYLKEVPGVLVVDNVMNLKKEILNIVNNPQSILTNAKETNDFAQANLRIDSLRNKLRSELIHVINSGINNRP